MEEYVRSLCDALDIPTPSSSQRMIFLTLPASCPKKHHTPFKDYPSCVTSPGTPHLLRTYGRRDPDMSSSQRTALSFYSFQGSTEEQPSVSGTSTLEYSTSAVQCAGTDTFETLNEVFSLWLGSVLLVNGGKRNVHFELSFRDGLFRHSSFPERTGMLSKGGK